MESEKFGSFFNFPSSKLVILNFFEAKFKIAAKIATAKE